VTHKINKAALEKLLTSPQGPVAKQLLIRGIRVQSQARRNLGGSTGTGPRRIDTGRLRSSIGVELRTGRRGLSVRVGTNVEYAFWVHDGTGLYGPRHRWIKPVTRRYLRFRPKGGQRWVYAQKVRGMKANPFLEKALQAAKIGPQPA
jgi:hypothetical protein